MTFVFPMKPMNRLRPDTSELDHVIHRISHELRTSVRALQELPAWIAEDLHDAGIALPDASLQQLDLIDTHACRMDGMLNGLLEYSRVGRLQVIGPVNPAEALETVIEDLAPESNADIVRRVDPGEIEIGDVDMHRIFAILLSNALRFNTSESPKVEFIGQRGKDGTWQLDVIDNGLGIQPALRQAVFRAMVRLHSRDTHETTGMGLAILKKIADSYDGHAEFLDPSSGSGAHARVLLNLRP